MTCNLAFKEYNSNVDSSTERKGASLSTLPHIYTKAGYGKAVSMGTFIDLTGQRFDKLTVVRRVDDYVSPKGQHSTRYLCKCDCGNEIKVTAGVLKNGKSKSCGCVLHYKDISNMKFGRLTAIKNTMKKNSKGNYIWLCKCECGNTIEVPSSRLLCGTTKSCGCYGDEVRLRNWTHKTHGMAKTRLYKIWLGMKERCLRKACPAYPNYGGRGIKVCKEWLGDFMNFHNWAITNGYDDKLSIDRIDVNGNYEPDNCRWATKSEQVNNTRRNIKLLHKGKYYTLSELANMYNINVGTVYNRYHSGMTIEEILDKKDYRIFRRLNGI